MLLINLKKEWKLHKPILLCFIIIIFSMFVFNFFTYVILKFFDQDIHTFNILENLWYAISGLANMILDTVLISIFMFLLIFTDLGRKNSQYTIFSPQSLFSWYLSNVMILFILQGLFSILDCIYVVMRDNIMNPILTEDPQKKLYFLDYMIQFFTSTFNFGYFALITLSLGLYFSFRNKKTAWIMIIFAIILYLVGYLGYSIYPNTSES